MIRIRRKPGTMWYGKMCKAMLAYQSGQIDLTKAQVYRISKILTDDNISAILVGNKSIELRRAYEHQEIV